MSRAPTWNTNVLLLDNVSFADPAAAVPEPATLTRFGVGLSGLLFRRTRAVDRR